MRKIKKVLSVFLILMILFMTIIVNSSMCLDFNPSTYDPGPVQDSAELKDMGNKIVGGLQLLGSITSVVTLIIIGIKYALGSVEEKAEYKETLMPYIIGAVLVFSVTNILGIINAFMN